MEIIRNVQSRWVLRWLSSCHFDSNGETQHFTFPCLSDWNMFQARTHRRRKCKFIQMAAEADLSLPVDHCGKGVCDLRPGRSKICGTVAGKASVFTDTHGGREQYHTYKPTAPQPLWKINQCTRATDGERTRDEKCGAFDQQHFSSSCR